MIVRWQVSFASVGEVCFPWTLVCRVVDYGSVRVYLPLSHPVRSLFVIVVCSNGARIEAPRGHGKCTHFWH